MPRPLMQRGVGELEALFGRCKADTKVLKQLEHELQYRHVPRAVALLANVQAAMSEPTSATPVVSAPPAASAAPPTPQQPALWEQPAVQPNFTAAMSKELNRPAASDKELVETVTAKPYSAPEERMSLEDAYKLLKATESATWESVEQARRHIVQQSHPRQLKLLPPDRRIQALSEARRVNAEYAALSHSRCNGHKA